MKKLFYLIILVVFIIFALTFMQQNPQLVSINYYAGLSTQASLPIVLFITLLVGVFLGFLLSLPARFRSRWKMKQAEKQAHQAEEKLQHVNQSNALVK